MGDLRGRLGGSRAQGHRAGGHLAGTGTTAGEAGGKAHNARQGAAAAGVSVQAEETVLCAGRAGGGEW